MALDIDTHFASRISQIENDLLNPIVDRSSLTAFNDQWLALVKDLERAFESQVLSPSTILIAHELAHRVPIFVQTFIDLETLSEKLISSLDFEASSILGLSFSTNNTSASLAVADTDTSTLHNAGEQPSIPAYIEPAYDWLLKNLHNPYPSPRKREEFALSAGSTRKDINSWFVDVRKRMGWNALRKRHFANKRVEIVDAATRFFIEDDPKRPLDPNIELDFAAIETRAKDLYSEKFSKSDLALKLDIAVKDMTPEMKVQAREAYRRMLSQKNDEKNVQLSRAISSYPSPDCSPDRSPELDLPPSVSCSNNTVPVLDEPITTRKRRGSSPEPSDNVNRPNKCLRLDITSPAFSGLPSPASLFHEEFNESDMSTASLPSSTPLTSAPNRKRRLSDADVQGAPKRPRKISVGPRLHAVSDPLPMSSALLEASSFDGWFKENFELPNVASVDELDPSIPVEVKFCDASVFNDSTFQLSSPAASSPDTPVYAGSSSVSPLASLPLETPPDVYPSEFDFTGCFDPNDFTHLLQGQSVVDKHELNLPFDIPPLDLGFSLNVFHPYTISPMPLPTQNIDMPVLPDLSTRVSAAPSEVDWSFLSPPPLQDIVGSEDKLDNFFDVFHPENFSFDLTMLDLTQPNSDVVDTTLADRAAKEKQLMEMKEAARKLEEELAASR